VLVPAITVEVAGVAPEVLGSTVVDLPPADVTVASVAPEVITPSSEPTPTLLLHFDGTDGQTTSTDSSPNALPITHFNGAALSTAAPLKFGTAYAVFDGVDDYILTSENDALKLTGQFCIDCWAYVADNTSLRAIYELGTFEDGVLLRAGPSGGSLYVNDVVVGGSNAVHSNIAYNDWTHIAVTRDGANAVRLFIGGNPIGSASTISGTVASSLAGKPLRIGGANHTSGQRLVGRVDEFRIVNGSAVWTAGFTPPTAPYS